MVAVWREGFGRSGGARKKRKRSGASSAALPRRRLRDPAVRQSLVELYAPERTSSREPQRSLLAQHASRPGKVSHLGPALSPETFHVKRRLDPPSDHAKSLVPAADSRAVQMNAPSGLERAEWAASRPTIHGDLRAGLTPVLSTRRVPAISPPQFQAPVGRRYGVSRETSLRRDAPTGRPCRIVMFWWCTAPLSASFIAASLAGWFRPVRLMAPRSSNCSSRSKLLAGAWSAAVRRWRDRIHVWVPSLARPAPAMRSRRSGGQ